MFGNPVPSARFMGGREFSLALKDESVRPSTSDIDYVLTEKIMLLPSFVPGTGPFPDANARWTHDTEGLSAQTLYVVVSFYLALVTSECLSLTGGRGDILVEGPFAGNSQYLAMLSAISKCPTIADATSKTGTSIGAAMLANLGPENRISNKRQPDYTIPDDISRYQDYASKWRIDCYRGSSE